MLSQEAIDDFKKKWYSFEEIQRVSDSLKKIKDWKVFSKSQAREIIYNFSI